MKPDGNMTFYRLYIFIKSYTGQKRILNFFWKAFRLIFRKIFGIKPDETAYYELWRRKWFSDHEKLKDFGKEIDRFGFQTKFRILLNGSHSTPEMLMQSVDSVIKQVYNSWELFIVLGKNEESSFIETVNNYVKNDTRINVTGEFNNKHSFINYNKTIENANDEFITFIKPGDMFSADALFHFAKAIHEEINIDVIYSDEDSTDHLGSYFDPYFKPDWCPDSFLSRNYIGNMVAIKMSLVHQTGISDHEIIERSSYDFLLRITELTGNIYHIPLILYHNKQKHASLAFDSEIPADKGKTAIEEALGRRGISGNVTAIKDVQCAYIIRYEIVNSGKVSVIIPSKNMTDLCNVAVTSVFSLTDYPDFEVILIDNNSDDPAFFEFINYWQHKEPVRFKCISDKEIFNFSRLMNYGVANANGKYLLLLNNDTEIIHTDWMTAMVEQVQFETTGAAGVKLIYKNDTIQHAGVIIGLGGIAGHAFVGFKKNARGYHNFIKCINNYSALTAACLMVRKEVYNEVKGFDEKLAVEYNDIDFCLKLKEKGYRNIYLPHVEVYHYESISRGHPHKTRKSYQQHLNDMKIFRDRWQKYIAHDPCYNPHLTRIFTDFRISVTE